MFLDILQLTTKKTAETVRQNISVEVDATPLQFNGDILKPHKIECELMKYRIKLGTWIYLQLNEAQREIYPNKSSRIKEKED
jgi:hypothetical protein